MAMKYPMWGFNPECDPKGDHNINGDFTSSMWRPDNYCATWEETFHTLTETYARLSSENKDYKDWSFEEGSLLAKIIMADINDGTYETTTQNEAENGGYDDLATWINEYVH